MQMYGTLSHQALGEFSYALATQQVDASRTLSHTQPDLSNARFSPPRLLRGILLFQSTFRRRKFRKDFGEIDGLEPCSPQVELALYLCRRMRNPGWVNLAKESMGLAGILYVKQRLSLTCIYEIHMQYFAALGSQDQGVQIMKEKLHLVVVQIQEELEAEVEAIPKESDWGMKVHPIIQRTRAEWCVPPALENSTLGAMVDKLDKYFSATLTELKERLIENPTMPQIAELHKESRDRLLGVYMTDFDTAVQKARRRRREYLIYELETRWEYPLDGNLGPYLAASEQYSVELPADCPQRKAFDNHVKRLKKRLEQEAKDAFDASKKKIEDLRRARDNAPQVKTVLKEFDVMLDDALIASQNLVAEWSDKLSVANPIVAWNAQSLLTPRSYQNLFLNAGERCAAQLRDPASSMGVICEARTCLNSVISILGDQGSMWNEEFPDLRLTAHKEKDHDEEDVSSSPTSSNGMPAGFETIEGIPLDHDQSGLHAQTFPIDRDVPAPNYAATLQLLRAFEVPEEAPSLALTTMAIDGDETLRVPSVDDPATDAGSRTAEAGTAIVSKPACFQEPRPDMQSGDRVLAQLTLFDLSIEDVHQYSEDVLAQKFTKAIADAGGIDPSRLRVLGFRPGSVKIFLEIDASVVFDLLREVQSQLQVAGSRLRRSDVGHFCNDAAFESIPRSAFKPDPPKLMSSMDKTGPLVNANSIFYRIDMFGSPPIADEPPVAGRQTTAADDDGSRVIYRTTVDPGSKKVNPYGHHKSYTFYDRPAVQLADRKWTPYAKFLVTRYPVNAPPNYKGYQSWCDLGKTAEEWISKETDQAAQKYDSRLQKDVKPSGKAAEKAKDKSRVEPNEKEKEDDAAATKKIEAAALVGGIEKDDQVDVETVRLGPQSSGADISLDETLRLDPPRGTTKQSVDEIALAVTKIQSNYRGRMGRKQWQAARLSAVKTRSLETTSETAAKVEVGCAPSAAEEVTETAIPVSGATAVHAASPKAAEDVSAATATISPEAADEVVLKMDEGVEGAAADDLAGEVKEGEVIRPSCEGASTVDDVKLALEMEAEMAVELATEMAAERVTETGGSLPSVKEGIPQPVITLAGGETGKLTQRQATAGTDATVSEQQGEDAGRAKTKKAAKVKKAAEGAGKKSEKKTAEEKPKGDEKKGKRDAAKEDKKRKKSLSKKGTPKAAAGEAADKLEPELAEDDDVKADLTDDKKSVVEGVAEGEAQADDVKAEKEAAEANKGEIAVEGVETEERGVEAVSVEAEKEHAVVDVVESREEEAAEEGAAVDNGEAAAECTDAEKMEAAEERGEATKDVAVTDGAEAAKDADAEDESDETSLDDAKAAELEAAEAEAAERAATEAARKEARATARADAKAKLAADVHAKEVTAAEAKKENELAQTDLTMLSSPKSSKSPPKTRPKSAERPLGDLSHLSSVRSWVGMLSGIQGTGLRGPVTKADDFVLYKAEQKQEDQFLASFTSPAFVRQQFRNKMVGIGPPYRTRTTKVDTWTWKPLPLPRSQLETSDWIRHNPTFEQRKTRLGPRQSVRRSREVLPPAMVGSPGAALRRKRQEEASMPRKPFVANSSRAASSSLRKVEKATTHTAQAKSASAALEKKKEREKEEAELEKQKSALEKKALQEKRTLEKEKVGKKAGKKAAATPESIPEETGAGIEDKTENAEAKKEKRKDEVETQDDAPVVQIVEAEDKEKEKKDDEDEEEAEKEKNASAVAEVDSEKPMEPILTKEEEPTEAVVAEEKEAQKECDEVVEDSVKENPSEENDKETPVALASLSVPLDKAVPDEKSQQAVTPVPPPIVTHTPIPSLWPLTDSSSLPTTHSVYSSPTDTSLLIRALVNNTDASKGLGLVFDLASHGLRSNESSPVGGTRRSEPRSSAENLDLFVAEADILSLSTLSVRSE